MKIHKLKLGPLNTNTYILEKENNCLIIDCPSDDEYEINKIKNITKDKNILGIIYTHNHFDHIGGGYKFKIPQFMHKKDIESIKNQIELGKYFNYPKIFLPNVKTLEKIPQEIKGIFNFKIIETPGHTKGGICILFEKEKIIFTGDTLFKGTWGRTDFDGNENDMKKSLQKILRLNPKIIVYPGHGHNSMINNEKNLLEKL